jgi:hypothetical protein
MEVELNYLSVCVNEPEKVIAVLEEYLGFYRCIYQPLPGLICNENGDHYLLQSPANTPDDTCGPELTILSNDCLRDYLKLYKAGFIIETLPHYTNDGLKVAVKDDTGNRFLIVEKRDYAEFE